MVEKTIFGTMEDGREVSRYTLTNQNGVSASFFRSGCNLVHDAGAGSEWRDGGCPAGT